MCLGCLVRWLYTSQRPVFPSSVDQYSTFIQNFSKSLGGNWREPTLILTLPTIDPIQSDALLVFLLHHIFLFSSKTVFAGKVRQQTAFVPETLQAVIEYGVLHHPSDTFKPLMWRGSSPHSPRCAAFCLAGTNTSTTCLYVSLEIMVQTTQIHSSQRWKESLKWNKPPESSVCMCVSSFTKKQQQKKRWGVPNN